MFFILVWHALCSTEKGDSGSDNMFAGKIIASNKLFLWMLVVVLVTVIPAGIVVTKIAIDSQRVKIHQLIFYVAFEVLIFQNDWISLLQ